MTASPRLCSPLSPEPIKLPLYYDCLDSSLPPPLSSTRPAPSSTRRPQHVQLLRTMLPLGPSCPGLSPLSSPTSPYAADDGSDSGSGWTDAPLSRRGEPLPEWITSPSTAESAEVSAVTASMAPRSTPARGAPLLPSHFLPPPRLRPSDALAASSPWTTGSSSPSSTLSSTHSPMSWASAAMSPSTVDLSPLPLPSSASLTPSSSWSSPSIASSTSPISRAFTFSPSTEPQPPRRRYQRTPGLSREQRAERRRQSHRELDAVRRHRDAAAISRLGQLTATAHLRCHEQPEQQQHNSGAHRRVKREHEADHDAVENDKKGKRHRTAVLEQSVEQMEELQILVDRLTAACAQQCSDIAALRLQLLASGVEPQRASEAAVQFPSMMPLLSASLTRRLAGELGVSGLYNSLFMSPSVGLMLVDCASGVALEVNERLVAGGLCTREDIIGRQVAPTYDAVIKSAEWPTQPTPQNNNDGAGQGAGGDSNASMYHQYGVTKESVLALYRGQVDQVHVVWRAQLGDGLAYELPLSGFVASRDDADGGRPRTVLVTLSLSEAKRI